MFVILISVAVGLLVFALIGYFFSVVGAIVPAVVLMVLTFFLIARKLGKEIEPAMAKVQVDLMKGHVDLAITKLEALQKRYGKWQLFLSSTIDGQIGLLFYIRGQYQKAKPYLKRSFVRHWVAKGMLALIYYRERKMNKMEEVFERTTRYVKNAGLLWSLWAYCVWRNGDLERAITILNKGKSHLRDKDPHLTQNLLSLQNDKRMKMKAYGEQWYQFQLELSPQQVQMKQGRVRFKNR